MNSVNEIQSGLTRHPKTLADCQWIHYDAEGSRIFEDLTQQDEYYLTRVERHILKMNADEIIAKTAGNQHRRLRIIELGAGTGSKTRILLAAAIRYQGPPVDYLPLDVSSSALVQAKSILEQQVPGVHVTPQICNYVTDSLKLESFDGCTLTIYIGSSIGSFSHDKATIILDNIRRQLQPGDALLLGVDMQKDPAILVRAYGDTNVVECAFNRNALHRLNHEFGYNFDLNQIRYRAVWNESESRIDMFSESLCSQKVRSKYLDEQSIGFDKGETILMGVSNKYTEEQLRTILINAGFEIEHIWSDEHKWFTVTLARIPLPIA